MEGVVAVTYNSNVASALAFDDRISESTKQIVISASGDLISPDRGKALALSLGLKRLFDVLVSAALLFLAAPLLAVVALLIVSQRDGGSIFYGQKRICRAGRQFYCYKFRSMCPDADDRLQRLLANDPDARSEWEQTHKLKNDPRVTPIGKILRSSSLDELPQLWNVLKGDLSLVGPRPVTQAELDGPYVRFRGRTEYLAVRPGITGLWQVSGRSLVGYEERVALDKQYVETLSLRRDLRILVRTVGVVLGRKGAC